MNIVLTKNVYLQTFFFVAVWECDPWERHAIIKRIVEYVLHRHFKLASQDLFHSVDQLDFCLHLNGKGAPILNLVCSVPGYYLMVLKLFSHG